MKLKHALLFVVMVVAVVASVAKADGGHVPFQAAHTGNWYDPGKPGVGVDVMPYSPTSAFVTVFAGQVPNTGGIPVWFAAQFPWHGNAPVSSKLVLTGQTFGGSLAASPVEVGHAVFGTDPDSCDHLTLDLTFNEGTVFGPAQHFDLVSLIQPMLEDCFTCPAVQFGPFDERCIDEESP